MRIALIYFLFLLYTAVIPVGLCVLLELRPDWFRRMRCLFWLIGGSIFSWCGVVGMILIPYYCRGIILHGPELVFALFFGWLYLWILGMPVFLIYGLMRLIHYLRRKLKLFQG